MKELYVLKDYHGLMEEARKKEPTTQVWKTHVGVFSQ
jgi:hypothetical protein